MKTRISHYGPVHTTNMFKFVLVRNDFLMKGNIVREYTFDKEVFLEVLTL